MKWVAILSLVCGVTFGCDSLSLDPDRASAPVVAWCAVGESAANKGVVTAEKTRDQMEAEELWNELRTKYIHTIVSVNTMIGVTFDQESARNAFTNQDVDASIMNGVIESIKTFRGESAKFLDEGQCKSDLVRRVVSTLIGKTVEGRVNCHKCRDSIFTCLDDMKSFLDDRIKLLQQAAEKEKAFQAKLEEAEKRAEERIKQEEEKRKQVEAELAEVKALLAALGF